MTSPEPRTHRASAQRRRAALLDAARELVGEVGAGAVTHRAVAKRAGVPLSTTSYFFDSIDDLVAEALKDQGHRQVQAFDAAERAWVFHEDRPTGDVIARVANELAELSPTHKATTIETFLAAARNDDVKASVAALATRFQERVAAQVGRIGAEAPDSLAWAILHLVGGSDLHRLAGVDDGPDRLAESLELLLAGALLTHDERVALFERVDQSRTAKVS